MADQNAPLVFCSGQVAWGNIFVAVEWCSAYPQRDTDGRPPFMARSSSFSTTFGVRCRSSSAVLCVRSFCVVICGIKAEAFGFLASAFAEHRWKSNRLVKARSAIHKLVQTKKEPWRNSEYFVSSNILKVPNATFERATVQTKYLKYRNYSI